MKLNYKLLGDYIREVNIRNTELKDLDLLGISIQKEFIQSIANTIGTDMSKYKIVKKNQFAYGTVTSRNGDKISIALLENYDEALISQAYISFEVIDENVLLPEYLMMWFRREEFDRYARYMSYGSAREVFSWDEMCNVKLPIPSIEKQREIVKEYNTVLNRIKLNQNMIYELENLAETIYRQWFIDFEFPDINCNEYKSNGGKMKYEQGRKIPMDWSIMDIENCINIYDSLRIPLSKDERERRNKIYPYYGAASLMDYVDDYIYDGTYILMGEDGTVVNELGYPILQYVWGKFWVNNHAHVITGKDCFSNEFIYLTLKQTNVIDKITGAVQAKINQDSLKSIKVIVPNKKVLESFNRIISIIFRSLKNTIENTRILNRIKDILLLRIVILGEKDEI
ncbi:restriction endonuclease subunit S [Clostridium perfringens]